MGLVRSIVARFHPLLRHPWASEIDDPKVVGAIGENIAALALEAAGFKILCRNFHGSHDGEVDIVSRDKRTLVFTEVKTRTSLQHGLPREAVTPAKQHLILRGAKEWLARLPDDNIPVRMDVVEVLLFHGQKPDITIIRDAFGDDE